MYQTFFEYININALRIVSCRIFNDDAEIYAAHSFAGDVCFDNSR